MGRVLCEVRERGVGIAVTDSFSKTFGSSQSVYECPGVFVTLTDVGQSRMRPKRLHARLLSLQPRPLATTSRPTTLPDHVHDHVPSVLRPILIIHLDGQGVPVLGITRARTGQDPRPGPTGEGIRVRVVCVERIRRARGARGCRSAWAGGYLHTRGCGWERVGAGGGHESQVGAERWEGGGAGKKGV